MLQFTILLLAGMIASSGAAPQTPQDAITIHLPDQEAVGRWVEVTPLASTAAPRVVFPSATAKAVLVPEAPQGLVMVCAAFAPQGPVVCEQQDWRWGTEATLRIPRGYALKGSCRQGREGVGGARVRLIPADLRTARSFSIPLRAVDKELVHAAVTAPSGDFHLPEIAPGEYRLEIHFPSGQLFHGEPFTVSTPPVPEPGMAPQAPVLDLGEIRPHPGMRVEVLLTDLDGAPVAGAEVGALQGASAEDLVEYRGTVGADGRGTLEGLAPDEAVLIVCQAPGFDRWNQRFDVPPTWLECPLAPLARLAGAVLNTDEKPLPGASVTIRVVESSGRPAPRTVTNDEGGFDLADLVPGDARLEVVAPGFRAVQIPLTLAPGDRRRIEPILLEPAPEILGTVIDTKSQEPVAGAVIEVHSPPGGGSAVTDAEGGFVLRAGGPEGLTFVVRADGYAESRNSLSARDLGDGDPMTISLSRGGQILVRAWKETSNDPCVGCRVSIQPGSAGPLITDQAGEALTEPLAPGTYRLQMPRVINRGSLVTVQGGQNQRSVVVHAGEITIVELGKDTESFRLDLMPRPVGNWWIEATAPSRSDVAWPDAEGKVLLHRTLGEALQLRLQRSGADGRTDLSIPLVSLSAEDPVHDLLLDLPDTAVTGTLQRDGEAITGQSVVLDAMNQTQQGYALTAADGGFTLPYLPPGSYLLKTEGMTLPVQVQAGRVSALGILNLP
jgi:hypothetical protein